MTLEVEAVGERGRAWAWTRAVKSPGGYVVKAPLRLQKTHVFRVWLGDEFLGALEPDMDGRLQIDIPVALWRRALGGPSLRSPRPRG